MTDKTSYKIIRLSDKKYSTGGQSPTFTKEGKTWNSIGFLKNHLSLFKYGKWTIYKGCRVESFKMVLIEKESVDIEEIFNQYSQNTVAAKLAGNHYW